MKKISQLKNNILIFLISIMSFFSVSVPAYRYDVPTNYYYADIETTELGQLHVYIPYNHKFKFGLNDNTFVNQTDKTLIMYAEDDVFIPYYIYFRPFAVERTVYRISTDSGMTPRSDLTITNILETNLPTLQASNFGAYAVDEPIIYILVLGVLLICMKFLMK